MTTKLTKNELIALNSALSAKVAALGTRVVDLEKELAAVRAKSKAVPPSPGKIAAAQHLNSVRESAQQLCAQYGASNVRRIGGEFVVLTPNGVWQAIQ